MNSVTAEMLVARVLATTDVGEAFFAGFQWLEKHPAMLAAWLRPKDAMTVRRHPKFESVGRRIEPLLQSALESTSTRGTCLGRSTYRRLKRDVYQMAVEAADDSEMALVVLALMVAIDERFGGRIRAGYYRYQGADARRSSVPVRTDSPMPKPWPAFGTGRVPFERLAPEDGIAQRRHFLEHQFARVIAPLLPPWGGDPPPGLHRSGEISMAASETDWRVATVDLLASLKELHEGGDADRFWTTGYESPSVAEEVRGRLLWALEICREAGAQLIVVPELTLSKELVASVASALGGWDNGDTSGLLPMMVVGQLHQPETPEGTCYRNRPAVITPDGLLNWEYWKARSFQMPWPSGKLEGLGEGPPHVLAVDTPLGRVAVTICLDFLDRKVQNTLRALRASVVVVPAMTQAKPIAGSFYPQSIALTADCRAATVFCNASAVYRGAADHSDHAAVRDRPDCGEAPRPEAPRTLAFVRGNTRVPFGTPMCSHEFDDPEASATVCIYRLNASITGGLSVSRDEPRCLYPEGSGQSNS